MLAVRWLTLLAMSWMQSSDLAYHCQLLSAASYSWCEISRSRVCSLLSSLLSVVDKWYLCAFVCDMGMPVFYLTLMDTSNSQTLDSVKSLYLWRTRRFHSVGQWSTWHLKWSIVRVMIRLLTGGRTVYWWWVCVSHVCAHTNDSDPGRAFIIDALNIIFVICVLCTVSLVRGSAI